ncbi:MAG TPA: ABC transporter permease [Streptosporangiaceae bacterium]|nr:ABC transporter permease [Streptosporangiaceae bacterium]
MTSTSPHAASLAAARLRPSDLAALASIGLATRKLRASLSALGIAIGVAAIVAVLGLAASSQAALLTEIARLGTNLLTVSNGQTLAGAGAELPLAAPGMIGRLPGVTAVQYTGAVNGVSAYRSPLIPQVETNALTVDAATLNLPAVVGTSVAQGRYLEAMTAREPVAVLGAQAAQLLGIDRIWPGERIWICDQSHQCPAGGMWLYVTGILNPVPDTYAPEINSAVLIGFAAAERYLGLDGHPSEIYVRTTPDNPAVTTAVDGLLGSEASPEDPGQVSVSQPSSALTAQADARGALDTLFLGLGAVALLVGAIGVANIMVISVLERRPEIGLRRALGATRGQIRAQFLAEATLLSLAGGAAGVILGVAATAGYARGHGEALVIPPEAWAGGLTAAVIIGALAGLLPAIRAARLSPTQALLTV